VIHDPRPGLLIGMPLALWTIVLLTYVREESCSLGEFLFDGNEELTLFIRSIERAVRQFAGVEVLPELPLFE
jgi:hypothetical protein